MGAATPSRVAGLAATLLTNATSATTAQAAPATTATSSETIHTTANHPWLTADHGWILAGDLRVGEPVRLLDGGTATVVTLHTLPGVGPMWDLSLDSVHTFAVGAVQAVVHNCPFNNQLPQRLSGELDNARQLGVTGISPNDSTFEQVANGGRMKWVVTESGDLAVGPKYVNGQEIYHTALSGGAPVQAAGEADVTVAGGQAYGIEITNWSGHYMPSAESLQIGRDAFAAFGILFP